MNPVEAFDGCADTAVHPDKVRLASANAPDANEIARVSAVFKLLGDPTRTRLLYALLEAGELCVCDLAAATATAEATVSQALRLLRASHITHHVPAQFENGPEAAGGPASVWTIGLIDPPDAFESSRP